MKPNVKNLTINLMGEDYVAECDFLEQHIVVFCRYDTYQRYWSGEAFRIDKTGRHRFFIAPHEMYSLTKLGSVHLALRMAKYSIMNIERPSCVAVDKCRIWAASTEEIEVAAQLPESSVTWKDRLALTSKTLWRRVPTLRGNTPKKAWWF